MLETKGLSMRHWSHLRRAVLQVCFVALVAIGFASIHASQLHSVYVDRAKEFKSKGVMEGTVRLRAPYDPADTLAEQLESTTLFLLTLARLDVATTITEESVYTWHVFRVTEALSPRLPHNRVSCYREPPPGVGQNEVAIQFPGGSTVVEGVTLTFFEDWVKRPVMGRQYLGFVALCAPNAGAIRHGPAGWLPVEADGTLTVSPGSRTAPEVVTARTLGRLTDVLKKSGK